MAAPESKCGIRRIGELLMAAAASVIVMASLGFIDPGGMVTAIAACGVIAMMICQWVGRRSVARKKQDERTVLMDALRVLSSAVEVKNAADFDHVSRVADIAEELGRARGLSDLDLDKLRIASYMHDIGKLGVPTQTLRRNDAPSEDEWELIRTHPAIGAMLLAGSGMDSGIVEAVRHHHEHWDGSGYPEGLSGGNIPMSARILAAADTCDALLSPRPDRERYSMDEARNILQRESGRKFDPALVVILMDFLDKGEFPHYEAGCDASPERVIAKENASGGKRFSGLGEAVRGIWSSEADGPLALASSLSLCQSIDAVMHAALPKLRLLVPYTTAVLYTLDERTGTISARFAEGQGAGNFQKITLVKGHGITGWAIANNKDIVANHAEMDFRPDIRTEMPAFSHAAVFAMSSEADCKTSFGALTMYLDSQELMPAFMRQRVKKLVVQIGSRLDQLLGNELTRSSPLSDPVTHLPTLSLLYAHAAREIAQARRHSYCVSFMEMELENYGDILQKNGKDETEKFLRAMARAIRRYLRDGDVLARISESEFAGIFPLIEHAQVEFLLRRLRNCLELFQYQTAMGENIKADVSFGCATFPENGKTCESLFLRANTQRFAGKMHQADNVAAGGGVHYGKVLPFRL